MNKPSLTAVAALVPMLCCAALSVANLSLNLFSFPPYADYSWVAEFIAKNVQAPRWLIHLKVQTAIFHTLESMKFARGVLPAFVHDPLSLARALNVLLLVLAGVHCYIAYPRLRQTTAWVIGSAAYCFMATGYAKVYGAATALLLMFYCFLEESNFDEDGAVLGVLSAVLGLYYLPLLPISVAVLLTLLIKKPKAFLPALLAFVLAGYVLVVIFWGQDVSSYFSNLWAESHFGNQFTAYGPYRGQAASEDSIFFSREFIFTLKHLEDKLYMLFFAGSLLAFGGACYETVRFAAGAGKWRERVARLTAMDLFCGLSAVSYLLILIGYMSKIGPREDLPFYSPFVVPFTFLWMRLRHNRGQVDDSPRLLAIGHYAYTAIVVIWSGIVGPPIF